jgi:hypothetical protein
MDNKEKKYSLVQLPSEIHEPLKKYCKENGMTMSGLLSILVKKHLKEKKK